MDKLRIWYSQNNTLKPALNRVARQQDLSHNRIGAETGKPNQDNNKKADEEAIMFCINAPKYWDIFPLKASVSREFISPKREDPVRAGFTVN